MTLFRRNHSVDVDCSLEMHHTAISMKKYPRVVLYFFRHGESEFSRARSHFSVEGKDHSLDDQIPETKREGEREREGRGKSLSLSLFLLFPFLFPFEVRGCCWRFFHCRQYSLANLWPRHPGSYILLLLPLLQLIERLFFFFFQWKFLILFSSQP